MHKLENILSKPYKKAYNNPGKVGIGTGMAISILSGTAIMSVYFATNLLSGRNAIFYGVASLLAGVLFGVITALALDRKQLQENSHNYQMQPLEKAMENASHSIKALESVFVGINDDLSKYEKEQQEQFNNLKDTFGKMQKEYNDGLTKYKDDNSFYQDIDKYKKDIAKPLESVDAYQKVFTAILDDIYNIISLLLILRM